MCAEVNRPTDGKGKAPPSAGRMWLVGLRYFGITSHRPAGALDRNTNYFNKLCAIAVLTRRENNYERR
jgi:hypothetical protein